MSEADDLAAEIEAALAEGSAAVGDGELDAYILTKGPNLGEVDEPVYGPDIENRYKAVLGSFTERERAGTKILSTDTKITLSRGTYTPLVSDELRVNGITYVVYGVDTLSPGGHALLHDVWARD